jgi:hypothetical protein
MIPVDQKPLTLTGQPKLEVADIFRRFKHLLEPPHREQAKVIRALLNCRTAILGGHKLLCRKCAYTKHSYNSCRNRHCPKCQFIAKIRWVEKRKSELLPIPYFHMVFTIPHEFNTIFFYNKKIAFDLLFEAMSKTLKEVAQSRLKAKIGFSTILHTWGQNLMGHPHIHAIVTGGGLSSDNKTWVKTRQNYLLPCRVLEKVFKAKLLSSLEKTHSSLAFPDNLVHLKKTKHFKKLLIKSAAKRWVIYSKPPFAGPEQVLKYLGNYTHRIAISNHRIKKLNETAVSFTYRDSKDQNKTKLLNLHPVHFMKRFLLHVLPPKFVRIRHFGLLAGRNKNELLAKARKHLRARAVETVTTDWRELLKAVTGADIRQCPNCNANELVEIGIINSPLAWDTS